jgi:DNA-directed RNA polymerase specialized sigma24 family protein
MDDPQPKDRRIQLYEEGFSIAEIAEMTNYSLGGVYWRLKNSEVQMRPPGRPRGSIIANQEDEP